MNSLPLHPAIVHFPLGLAITLPILAAIFVVAQWKKWLPERAWIIVVGLQALLLAGALVGINTGEKEEERVERVVAETHIQAHEELAEQLAWGAGIVLALALARLIVPAGARRWTGVAATAGMVVVAGLALRVGHSGGQLVYTYGAASAYSSSPGGQPGTGPATEPAGREREREE